MYSMFRKRAASRKSDAYSDSNGSESDAGTTSAITSRTAAEPLKPPPPPAPETKSPSPSPPPPREPMSSELWTVIILLLVGVIGRLAYAKFGGIEFRSFAAGMGQDSFLAGMISNLDTQEGTIGAVVIGVWEGVLLHQVMRLSARAAAGVFAGLAGRLLLDLVSAPPGHAVRFTASLLGISLGVLLSEVVRGVFDERDHWEDRKITHYHNRSRRIRKSSGRRRRTTSGETLEDPDMTDDPRSVAPSTAVVSTRGGARSDYERPRHRRAISDRDAHSRTDTVVRVVSPLPSVLTGDLEAEIAELRRQANAAAGQQRKYQEEQKYEYAQGNGARALQLAWEVKRYEALAESLTRQVGDKIVEAHRRAVDKELGMPLPARSTAPSRIPSSSRPGGYYSENDATRNPVKVTVSAGGQTYEMTANEEEVEIGPDLRVRTRHVYQPQQSSTRPQAPSSSRAAASGRSASSRTPEPSSTRTRPPRSTAPRSKDNNLAPPAAGGTSEDTRSVPIGSRARSR